MSERKIINENDRPEFLGQIMDVFEDFLEAKGVHLPDTRKKECGDDHVVILTGSDYDSLSSKISQMMVNWSIF